ncbi:Riboflavin biosynthesis protein RibF [Hartmannibacter diazotrophicus]|uniref:Riboflavin biosynthesis protein n=1 Tax=Hartmannibacter diazotrophicus TaxID=1482074 RepID=A0A2C9D319_9HYPH|nr:bifunctional riboflavin kinase/FAD synthetase [Hartmannibacter diazotrophicus]SON54623.1 Riboflavin biosynthesis protein RibF [Hartmannibacter diazotrophicus]
MPTSDARPAAFPCDLAALPASLRGGVVAIGNFDGMHRGHQAVLADTRQAADAIGAPALALTFEPHPRSFFRPDQPVFRLTPLHAKALIAEALELDGLVFTPFDADFAASPPERFVDEVIVGRLGARQVVVGWDFHFGAKRAGNAEYLVEAGKRHGFDVTIVGPFDDEGGETISSSRIRMALARGDLALASGLLGYRWFFEGVVKDGDKRGRTIGYPTANIALAPECELRQGIYAVMAEVDGERHSGVASYGRRPTFDNGAPVFETFIFDFTGDLYGKTLRVTPVSYLRGEEKFDSVEALIAQMDKDSEEARAVLAGITPVSGLDTRLMFG